MLHLVAALVVLLGATRPALAAPGSEVAWVEDFASDPVAAGRFVVRPAEATDRFTYDAGEASLTAHYDTLLATAWYLRPIDPASGRVLGRYDDFEFAVTFRVCGEGFFADPWGFAQIAWGLVNSQTTGPDRAGGSAGPFAFDCVTFDYFPNVSPLYGGPTIGPTIIHSDNGAGFFANIDFAFGAETTIKPAAGDESIQLDTVYTARVSYDGLAETATVTIRQGETALAIGTHGKDMEDGKEGYGGFDGDPATIQTPLSIDNAFIVDSFALTAWQDTFSPYYASVIADVDIWRIEFHAPAVVLGDMNRDGLADGNDIGPFVQALTASEPAGGLVYRGDFTGDGVLDLEDVPGFVAVLTQP